MKQTDHMVSFGNLTQEFMRLEYVCMTKILSSSSCCCIFRLYIGARGIYCIGRPLVSLKILLGNVDSQQEGLAIIMFPESALMFLCK